MSSVNQSQVQDLGGGKWRVVKEVLENEVPSIVDTMRNAKVILDTIQSNFGTIQSSDPTWDGWTEVQREENLRKAVVALSEVVEEYHKILIYLTGKAVDK